MLPFIEHSMTNQTKNLIIRLEYYNAYQCEMHTISYTERPTYRNKLIEQKKKHQQQKQQPNQRDFHSKRHSIHLYSANI